MRRCHRTQQNAGLKTQALGEIGGRSTAEIENDGKMFKEATGTMMLLVYVVSIEI